VDDEEVTRSAPEPAGEWLRVGPNGVLTPEEIVPAIYNRPESIGRGLHAVVEQAEPWRDGKPVEFKGSLKGATAMLLWFRLNERPIEGTHVWNRAAQIVAPAAAIALKGLAADSHLVVTAFGDHQPEKLVDPDDRALTAFLRKHLDWGWWTFRAYCGRPRRFVVTRWRRRDFDNRMAGDLARWPIVVDSVYDGGALEIWSSQLDANQIQDRLDLTAINSELSAVDLSKYAANEV
jgi:hypothetical protein